MGKINSRGKGKRGELDFVHFLKDRGIEARRGQQYSGGTDSPDVICEELSEVHFEVKYTERLQLYKAMDQAITDSAGKKTPVVIHRMNKRPWVAILAADDLIKLYEKAGMLGEFI